MARAWAIVMPQRSLAIMTTVMPLYYHCANMKERSCDAGGDADHFGHLTPICIELGRW
jgi:hypothetical protein